MEITSDYLVVKDETNEDENGIPIAEVVSYKGRVKGLSDATPELAGSPWESLEVFWDDAGAASEASRCCPWDLKQVLTPGSMLYQQVTPLSVQTQIYTPTYLLIQIHVCILVYCSYTLTHSPTHIHVYTFTHSLTHLHPLAYIHIPTSSHHSCRILCITPPVFHVSPIYILPFIPTHLHPLAFASMFPHTTVAGSCVSRPLCLAR